MANKQSWADIENIINQAINNPGVNGRDIAHLSSSLVHTKIESEFDKLSAGVNTIITKIYEFENIRVKLGENELNRRKAILKEELDYFKTITSNALKTIEGSFSKTANDIAYENARAMRQNVIANVKMQQAIRVANAQAALSNKMATQKFIESAIGMMQGAANILISTGTALTSETLTSMTSLISGGNKQITSFVGVLSGGLTGTLAGISKIAINAIATAAREQVGLDIAKAQLELNQMEAVNDITNQYLDAANDLLDPWQRMVETVQKLGGEIDTAGRKLSVTMGYYGVQGDEYITHMLSMGESMADTFGKTATDLIETQKQYAEAAERNVMLSQSGQETIASTERLFGMSQGEAASLYGGMNIFNTSVESGANMMTEMYRTVTKMGLSTSKFGKDLVNNLKLAQKYNFKGGVENMMKLTQWAAQTRFNLNSATSFADKLTGSVLSDALETSAKLQVLGGSAAIYSDPLGMLYDAGVDIGSLAHRQANMFNDLMGTFDKITGETTFSWYENYMIKQRAAAMGMDEEDAKNMIRQKNKQGIINRELKGYGLSDEEKVAIGNRATYNKTERKWQVTNLKGEQMDMSEVAKHPDLLKDILPEDNDEAMLTIAQKSLGYQEQQTNYQKVLVSRYAYTKEGENKDAAQYRLESEKDFWEKNIAYIDKAYDAMNQHITRLDKLQWDRMASVFGDTGMTMMENTMKGFERAAGKIDPLSKEGADFYKAMEEFSKGINSLTTFVTKNISGGMPSVQETIEAFISQYINIMKELQNPFGWTSYGGNSTNNAKETNGTKPGSLKDGYGNTNGGYIVGGGNNITSINDGIVKTHPQDQFMAAKPGGPFDTLFNGIFGEINSIGKTIKGNGNTNITRTGNNTLNIQISGSLNLNENGQSYNILEKMKTNDVFATEFASVIAKQMSDIVVHNANGSTFNWGSI